MHTAKLTVLLWLFDLFISALTFDKLYIKKQIINRNVKELKMIMIKMGVIIKNYL